MADSSSRVRTTLRALRHRNFQLFFAGQLISLIGTWMQNVAQAWLVYRLTGSSVLLGLVGLRRADPGLPVSPLGGLVADRHSRHRIVIATQTAAMMLAFILAALTLTGTVQVWHIFVLAALLGVVNAFDIPARQSFLVEMVGREDLINAIALNSSMFNGARIIGPAIAGILVAAHRRRLVLFRQRRELHCGHHRAAADDRHAAPTASTQGSALAHMIEGFRFVDAHRAHSRPAVAAWAGESDRHAVCRADADFRRPHLALAARAAWASDGRLRASGALVGALLLARAPGGQRTGPMGGDCRRRLRRQPDRCSRSRARSGCRVALLMPVGFAMMTQMGASNTLIQTMAPDRLRGRVMSVYSMMFMGMAPARRAAGRCGGGPFRCALHSRSGRRRRHCGHHCFRTATRRRCARKRAGYCWPNKWWQVFPPTKSLRRREPLEQPNLFKQ